MKRAEARKKLEEEERKREAEKEAQRGDVQKLEREKKREDLREAKYLGVARYADDEEMNEELKARDRWDDPAAGFLTDKAKKGKSVSGKPLYQGGWQPNRYGIRPGHKWDGVDRGNGSEAERFAKLNQVKGNRELEYAWQMDE
jgi:pre-mRNA-splicing factor CWC26